MTVVVAVLAALVVVAVAALVWRERAARAAEDLNRRRLARAEARASDAEARADSAEDAAGRLEAERSAAAAQLQASSDRVLRADARLAVARRQAEAERSALEGLWQLAVIEGHRAWQLTMAETGSTTAPATLAASLEAEVERLREEAGTPGVLCSKLTGEPRPADSLVALRGVQALLAVLVRHCDGYRIELEGDTDKVVATLVCQRFDGGEAVLAEAGGVADAVAPCGGALDVRRAAGDELRARLTLTGTPYAGY